jgi:hypothetical protein
MDHSKVEAKLADIAVFIEEAEKAAYARGFQDALDKVAAEQQVVIDKLLALTRQINEDVRLIVEANSAEHILSRTPKVEMKQEPRDGSDQARVLGDIRDHPGTRGFEIVKRLEGQVHERTIRTSIHRLRLRGAISKQGEKWFPATMTLEISRAEPNASSAWPRPGGMAERPNAADSKSVWGP